MRDYKKVCRCRDCGKIYDKGIPYICSKCGAEIGRPTPTIVYAGRASIMQRALLSIRKKCHTTGTRVSFAIYAIILMEKVPKIWKERNAMNM